MKAKINVEMNLDFELLRAQKRILVEKLGESPESPEMDVVLEGVLSLIDYIQDAAIDQLDIDPIEILNYGDCVDYRKATEIVINESKE